MSQVTVEETVLNEIRDGLKDIRERQDYTNARLIDIDKRLVDFGERLVDINKRLVDFGERMIAFDKRLTIIETTLTNQQNAVNKIPELAEKVGELKNWRTIGGGIVIAVFTWFLRGNINLN